MRLTKIAGMDLRVFEFDYDLTWMAFFLNADQHVYGRYGGRDASGAEKRMSLAGLRYSMKAALDNHRLAPNAKPAHVEPPLLPEQFAGAKRFPANQCIHCHNILEFQREALQAEGKWNRDMVWIYPLPENLGITLDNDQGDKITQVKADSAGAKAGLRNGDLLRELNRMPVWSFADAQFALHKAPAQGRIAFVAERGKERVTGNLEVKTGWRETNITWRQSFLDMLPSLSMIGQDLTVEEKMKLGLQAKRLAFRQDKNIHPDAAAIGVQPNDVIVGIDDKTLEMDMLQFLGYMRRNYRVGEKVTLNVIRNGKPVNLKMTLR